VKLDRAEMSLVTRIFWFTLKERKKCATLRVLLGLEPVILVSKNGRLRSFRRVSALEALRNALYKFKTYLLT